MAHGWTRWFLALALTVGCGAKPDEQGPGSPTDGATATPDAGSTPGHPDGGPWIRRIVALEVTPSSLKLKVGNTSVTIIDANAPYAVELLDCTRHLEEAEGPGQDARALSGG